MANSATKRVVTREKKSSNGTRHTTNGNNQSLASEAGIGANENGNGSVCRTTAVFPAVLNVNWELCALKKGLQKNEVLVAALIAYLKSEGFDPHRTPRFEVSYPS